jgi:hypothetical protein
MGQFESGGWSYHDFPDWIGFGGPVIKSGNPIERAKQWVRSNAWTVSGPSNHRASETSGRDQKDGQ